MPSNLTTIEEVLTEARYFWNVVKSAPATYQVSEAQAQQLDELTTLAETALAQRTATENLLTTRRATFKGAFGALDKFFRPLRQSVKDNPATTDVQRAELHLVTGGGEAGETGDALEFAPLVLAENSGVHQHRIRFFMQGEQSGSTKKAERQFGRAKIYRKIGGEATTDLKDYDFVALDTKSPYALDFEAADAGKQAHYVVVWTNADDDDSPQSEVFSLVIT